MISLGISSEIPEFSEDVYPWVLSEISLRILSKVPRGYLSCVCLDSYTDSHRFLLLSFVDSSRNTLEDFVRHSFRNFSQESFIGFFRDFSQDSFINFHRYSFQDFYQNSSWNSFRDFIRDFRDFPEISSRTPLGISYSIAPMVYPGIPPIVPSGILPSIYPGLSRHFFQDSYKESYRHSY